MDREDKNYDLEERSFRFARDVRDFVKHIPHTAGNNQDIPQLVRASGSASANYLEANDALGDRDFLMRMRIARKEAKESRLFLRLLDCHEQADLEAERDRLVQEAMELKLIYSAIIKNGGG